MHLYRKRGYDKETAIISGKNLRRSKCSIRKGIDDYELSNFLFLFLVCADKKSTDKSVLDQLVEDSDDDDQSVEHEVPARLCPLPKVIFQEFPGRLIRKAVLVDNGTVVDFY